MEGGSPSSHVKIRVNYGILRTVLWSAIGRLKAESRETPSDQKGGLRRSRTTRATNPELWVPRFVSLDNEAFGSKCADKDCLTLKKSQTTRGTNPDL